ncbi:MAG TPA: O-antigen ligase family protein [Chitinophagaceae bacterium]|nr:O-antigen ligase family protein [Chitinophagaceae bacterium]
MNTNRLRFALFAGIFILFLAAAAWTEKYFLAAAPFIILFLYLGWGQMNFIFFLLLASLPFSAEYHFSSSLGTDIPDEFFMLFVSTLFFLYYAFRPQTISKKILHHPLQVLLFIGLAWTFITVLFSTDWFISLKFFLAKCWYVGAFVLFSLILFKQKQNIKSAAKVFAIALFTVVFIILIRHAVYGFRFADINKAVFPFFRNHVNYSAMLVCSVPLFMAFHKLSCTAKEKILFKSVIIILLIALFFSYARGAWLALIIGLITYILIRKKILVIAFATAIILSLGFLFWEKNNDHYLKFANDFKTTIYHTNFREHLIATYRLKDVSTAERFYRWIAGVRMIGDGWLTGYRPNTFYYNYKPYAIPAFKTWVSDNKEHSTVHNYFLLITIEQGIPGLIFFLLLLGAMLYYAQNLYHRMQDTFYKTASMTVGVILSMLIVVNFLSDLVETDKIGSIFFLCLSVLIAIDINNKETSDSSPDIQSIS